VSDAGKFYPWDLDQPFRVVLITRTQVLIVPIVPPKPTFFPEDYLEPRLPEPKVHESEVEINGTHFRRRVRLLDPDGINQEVQYERFIISTFPLPQQGPTFLSGLFS